MFSKNISAIPKLHHHQLFCVVYFRNILVSFISVNYFGLATLQSPFDKTHYNEDYNVFGVVNCRSKKFASTIFVKFFGKYETFEWNQGYRIGGTRTRPILWADFGASVTLISVRFHCFCSKFHFDYSRKVMLPWSNDSFEEKKKFVWILKRILESFVQ